MFWKKKQAATDSCEQHNKGASAPAKKRRMSKKAELFAQVQPQYHPQDARVQQALVTMAEQTDNDQVQLLAPPNPDYVIEGRMLHRVYETAAGATHALRGVSLGVKRGEFVAIMGPSGSGKSTLMNILGCLDTPTYGRYFLEGIDISMYTDDELAEVRSHRLGFVFQSFNLLPRATVLRNVMLPLVYAGVPERDREEMAIKALIKANIDPKLFEHKSNEISGGQMQRVAIARALVNNPALILADEPTGNLDSATSEMILNLFKELKDQGSTIVLITHDVDVARHADRALMIKDGELYTGMQEDALRAAAAEFE